MLEGQARVGPTYCRPTSIDEELYTKPINRLRRTVTLTNLDGGWNQYRQFINDADMRSLRHIAHELTRYPLPPDIEKSVLDELQAEVNGLYELVGEANAADVPEALRRVILEGLWEILMAIRLHTAKGAAPLHRALLMNVGTLVTEYPLFEQYKEAEAVSQYRGLVKRLWQIIPHAADISELIGAGVAAVRALLSDGQ